MARKTHRGDPSAYYLGYKKRKLVRVSCPIQVVPVRFVRLTEPITCHYCQKREGS